MTTYAPNFTPRVKVKYQACGIEHTIQFRKQRGATASDMTGVRDQIRALFNIWVAALADDFTFLEADYALTDSDDFISMALPTAIVGLVAAGDYALQQRVTHTNFNGKAAGSRASVFLYGILWEQGLGTDADNGRTLPGEDARVTTSVTLLSSHLFAGSGAVASPHNYANIKVNDRLLKLLRTGAIS